MITKVNNIIYDSMNTMLFNEMFGFIKISLQQNEKFNMKTNFMENKLIFKTHSFIFLNLTIQDNCSFELPYNLWAITEIQWNRGNSATPEL